jgi:hypothetical protein
MQQQELDGQGNMASVAFSHYDQNFGSHSHDLDQSHPPPPPTTRQHFTPPGLQQYQPVNDKGQPQSGFSQDVQQQQGQQQYDNANKFNFPYHQQHHHGEFSQPSLLKPSRPNNNKNLIEVTSHQPSSTQNHHSIHGNQPENTTMATKGNAVPLSNSQPPIYNAVSSAHASAGHPRSGAGSPKSCQQQAEGPHKLKNTQGAQGAGKSSGVENVYGGPGSSKAHRKDKRNASKTKVSFV